MQNINHRKKNKKLNLRYKNVNIKNILNIFLRSSLN